MVTSALRSDPSPLLMVTLVYSEGGCERQCPVSCEEALLAGSVCRQTGQGCARRRPKKFQILLRQHAPQICSVDQQRLCYPVKSFMSQRREREERFCVCRRRVLLWSPKQPVQNTLLNAPRPRGRGPAPWGAGQSRLVATYSSRCFECCLQKALTHTLQPPVGAGCARSSG